MDACLLGLSCQICPSKCPHAQNSPFYKVSPGVLQTLHARLAFLCQARTVVCFCSSTWHHNTPPLDFVDMLSPFLSLSQTAAGSVPAMPARLTKLPELRPATQSMSISQHYSVTTKMPCWLV